MALVSSATVLLSNYTVAQNYHPVASLAGLTVTGGRVNAAAAVSATSIVISDPSIAEGDAARVDSQLGLRPARAIDSEQAVARGSHPDRP